LNLVRRPLRTAFLWATDDVMRAIAHFMRETVEREQHEDRRRVEEQQWRANTQAIIGVIVDHTGTPSAELVRAVTGEAAEEPPLHPICLCETCRTTAHDRAEQEAQRVAAS
jgi:hypothetical protein